jgi:hypothetical protein
MFSLPDTYRLREHLLLERYFPLSAVNYDKPFASHSDKDY